MILKSVYLLANSITYSPLFQGEFDSPPPPPQTPTSLDKVRLLYGFLIFLLKPPPGIQV